MPQARFDRAAGLAATSALFHLLLITGLLYHRHIAVAPMKLPGDEHGHRLTLTFTPGRAIPQATVAAPAPLTRSASSLHAPVKAATTPAPVATPGTAATAATPGNDAFGSGNVTLALATFFPRPAPELPAHTHGDVIVDVTIDETGRITTSKVTQGLAPAIDETVLATIQTWTFKPATKDGIAVPSEQELLFHYDRA